MIKAKAEGPDGPLLIFGLSRMNTERLHADMPIRINLAELGMSGTVLIVAGETEEAIAESLKPFMSPDTKVTDRKSGKRPA